MFRNQLESIWERNKLKMLSEFAKEKVFWTKKMNLRLVKFIERRPNIWNPKHPRYTSIDYRDQTYAEFASKCGDKFTGQAVKDRWTNIRSTFRSYLKKYNDTCATNEIEDYKVSWYLWQACQFLMEVDKTVKAVPRSTAEDKNNDSQELNQEFKQVLSDDADDISESSTPSTDCKEIANNLFKIFQGVQNDSFGIKNTRNGRIGKVVADRLSQMSPLDAAEASTKIMEILYRYDDSNPNNPNNYSHIN